MRAKGSLNSSSPKREINSCLRLYGNLLQLTNAQSPMLVTLSEMTMLDRELQSLYLLLVDYQCYTL